MAYIQNPYADVDAAKLREKNFALDIFTRPASTHDLGFMVGLLQEYGVGFTGPDVPLVERFLAQNIGNAMVTIKRAGALVGFGLHAPYPKVSEQDPVLILYTKQDAETSRYIHSLVRGFSLVTLAHNRHDANPKIKLLMDWDHAATALALKPLAPRQIDPAPRKVALLSGERDVVLCELDDLVKKFTRIPPRGPNTPKGP